MTELNDPAGHDPSDFEDIPPRLPTPRSRAMSARLSALVELLRFYEIPFTEEPGWLTRNTDYHWYDGAPHGVMIHHTATASYAPASAYPEPQGNRTDGKTICNILVQPDGTVNLVSADPANYSSGLNWKDLLDEYVTPRIRFHGPQSGDLGPEWYGNRAWINIETVHLGDGSEIPYSQERSLIVTATLICYLMGWDSTAVIGHYDGRGTKVDPRWTGRYETPPYSIAGIQDKVQNLLDNLMVDPGEGGDVVFVEWVVGLVTGWSEDPTYFESELTRLKTEGKFNGDVDYWVGLLIDPENYEWRGFVSRTVFLSTL